MDSMAAIKVTFFQECEEQLSELELKLIDMEEGAADGETLNAIFRAVHSIKGGAGAFKLHDLVRFAHVFETTLDDMRNGRLAAGPDVLKTLLRAADVLADLVHAARDGSPADQDRSALLADELAAFSPNASAAEHDPTATDGEESFSFDVIPISFAPFGEAMVSDQAVFKIAYKPHASLYAKGNETIMLMRELARLGTVISVVCDASAVPTLSEADPEGSYLSWTIDLATDKNETAIREVFEFVDDDCDLEISAVRSSVDDGGDILAALLQSIRSEPAETDAALTGPAIDTPACNLIAFPEKAKVSNSDSTPKVESGKVAKTADAPQATIRVDIDKVDRLINLVGELVIHQAMLSQRVVEAGLARSSHIATGLEELGQLTREIQESVMATRAQPVKSLFQRMSRIVREVADVTGKTVRLKTDGEATEVDNTMVERLADPLTHMIRNAIDHGVEKPEKRLACGKPAEGVIHLSAAHRSGRIVIEVADDGAGINRPRVREIAVTKGLIAADAVLTDNEIDNLILLPGFSTAETVSNISGRGVGMDVVKRSIQALGGRLNITSRPGNGSTFTMSLPLTLAVLDGMVVRAAGQMLVVPLTAIVETLKPSARDVHTLGENSRVIAIRGSFLPLIDVGCELGYRSMPADALNSVVILVETESGVRSALLVDAIHDQRQVVIKSLEANYAPVDGIAAATILGDGRIALILDVDSILDSLVAARSPNDSNIAATG